MKSLKRNFVQIIDKHQGIINSLCKAYYLDPNDQKDTFQDIIFQLWKSFDTFRGASEISTWIYRVGLNTILAKVRKEKRGISTEYINASHANKSISKAIADDDLQLLHIIIQSLNHLDKAIVILHLEGYRNKEISQLLKLTPTNVSTRLNRIRTELKSKFKIQNYEFK
ncbi:sigma-70 family RNA polymerase sigma factor [Fulvivirgaceae bacterium BMA12]|uniref:Sigma-70 family RNA polymerase sigma factor n=1 Tax=Agaribacillus aureus TaxID=3051825 RepID=A0ABT8LDE4_9BACT|nr:sigma-70 family RNA polymerase sigma factor [Fulvivirgaceae bacterium BMA12]